ncbi:PSD1 and planctomycete cytochrome C domain-containing protein [Chitinophaga sp. sic0106]|uniref:PSD1 and planctomycete cytochrome C domain-containing protein n=1 Tax=Chitinophaga sp. sic0106 TaxID=2854785 RepID=UPI001C43D50A|nr:PSD1 and planctomycete cytochrome C domain-containing protein [Chitinophaga sp. sic0106]MBV7531069.1 PSD1 and planctomycete cytochrome C domain-containing protein [Chitinophaga sp. sic0106]
MKLQRYVNAAACALAILTACNHQNGQEQSAEKMPDIVDYNFHVRPILSDKCFACHGPDANKREAGLRLDIGDSAYKALKDSPGQHALVPGNPMASVLFQRISTTDTAMRMPPASSNLVLSSFEVKLIEKWIKQGAKYKPHWAFVVPATPPIPAVPDPAWTRNAIDYFTLAKMTEKGLSPNPVADQERLLKRLSLDLTGLPPTPERMQRFAKDSSSKGYEQIVDELLQDSAYGEKMAVHWMDVARYADSHGYQDDNYRSMWPWRDWVIHAFNRNLSYKDFVTWQIAGDMMPAATREQLLASAFNRNHKITEEGGVIDEEYRIEYVTDRTNTFGKSLLGITIECAHCHDHKYDPFSQKEYYQLFAFFNNVTEVGLESVVGGPETYAKKPFMEISREDLNGVLHFLNKRDTSRLIVSVMGERDTTRKTYILGRGNYDNPTDEVTPGTPVSVLPFNTNTYPANRLGLARWLFDPANPLTARVFVNQIWQEFFGKGIVKSTGDFGMQGDLPSNPALLDWLAVDFQQHGWNIKRLVKQLVMSATYRQSAVISPEKLKADPENIYLARGPRFRLPAETVRDLVLQSSGLLVHEVGGPSVKPYQPVGLWEQATSGRGQLSTYRQDHGESLYRRGLYTFIKRTVPPPSMMIFDASNRDQCEVKRSATNTPLQALMMLNDPTVLEASRVLASRLMQEGGNTKQQIQKAFQLIVCRSPQTQETATLLQYYTAQQSYYKKERAKAAQLLHHGEFPMANIPDQAAWAAMMQVITTIYNLEETLSKT